jgi:putative membrane protein
MMGYGWGMGLGGWLVMIGGLIVLVAIIVLAIWGVGAISRPREQRPEGPARAEPLDILRERFARGEISEDQFAQAKRALGYEP